MNGISGTASEPENSLNRAMLVTVLYRSAGSPAVSDRDNFSDTVEGACYADAVLWASQQGLTGGYGNGLFGTNDPVTREQMTTILWRYAGSPTAEGTASFAEGDSVASYAAAAVNWADANNIVRPVSGNAFAPKENATRAQAAAVLMNYDRSTHAGPSDASGGGAGILVAYFSRYGNTDYDSEVDATTSASVVLENGRQRGTTERIVRMVAEQVGGDLHLIETVDAYPTDFDDVRDRNHQEIVNGTRPALDSYVDTDGYDVIFVGCPVWASTVPAPVLSFLESQNLSGKTVVPFCTHDGYGAGSSYSAVRSSGPGAVVEQGLAIAASDAASSERTVADWLNALRLPSAGAAGNAQPARGETAIHITIGERELDGVLYDSPMARQFIAQLPQTLSMSNYGGREVYGGIAQAITAEGEGQLHFADGDITYCPGNNTAAIFYSQSSRPNLTMTVYPIGKVTSDLSIFPDLPSWVEITFAIVRGRSACHENPLFFLWTLVLCLALTACGVGQGTAGGGTPPAPAASQVSKAPDNSRPGETPYAAVPAEIPNTSRPEGEPAKGSSTLIVYFTYGENAALADGMDASASASIQLWEDGSLTGNTGFVADMIAEATGGKLFSILTAEQYLDNYSDTIDVGQEEKNAGVRPELASRLDGLDSYNTIFLGFPNWWGDMLMALYRFLEEYDLSAKTIAPFVTSGGSGFSGIIRAIEDAEPDAIVLEGLSIYDDHSPRAEGEVADWLTQLGLAGS